MNLDIGVGFGGDDSSDFRCRMTADGSISGFLTTSLDSIKQIYITVYGYSSTQIQQGLRTATDRLGGQIHDRFFLQAGPKPRTYVACRPVLSRVHGGWRTDWIPSDSLRVAVRSPTNFGDPAA